VQTLPIADPACKSLLALQVDSFFPGCDIMIIRTSGLIPRTDELGFVRVVKRTWYKKGEYRLKRPHGISESSFRPGDGWSWLSV